MALLKQSTAYTRMFMMIDSADHVTGKTALTVTVNLSKAGGAFAAAGGTITEVSSGWYKIALTTTDTNTLGDLAFQCTATGADPTSFVDAVVAIDVADATAFGLSRLDAAITSRMATFTLPTNFSLLSIDASGRVDLGKWIGIAPNALISGRVDANVGVNSDKTGYALTSLESMSLHSGTAQAGAAGTITLAAGASATDSLYNGLIIKIYGGTGVGQSRVIVGYAGATKVATVDTNWITNPDATSTYSITAIEAPKLNSSQQVTSSQAYPTNFSSLSIDASGRIDLAKWIGTVPNILIAGRVDANAQVVGDKTGYTVSTVSDKTGYTLSAAGVQAVWDALTSALTTVGSVGKRISDNIDVVLSTRATPAQVQTSVAAELDAAGTELTAIPGSTATIRQIIRLLFQYFRNKRTVTATTESMFKEDSTTVLGTSVVSDDGTTFTKAKAA